MFAWPAYRPRGALCSYDSEPGEGSAGSGTGTDAGEGSSSGNDNPGASPPDPAERGFVDRVVDAIFGPPEMPTEEKVANAFVDLVTAAIPGAGLMQAAVAGARALGLSVEPATPPDRGDTGGDQAVPPPAYAQQLGPYRTPTGNPFAGGPAAPGVPSWAGTAPNLNGPYSSTPLGTPSVGATDSASASGAGSGGAGGADPYAPPEKPLWPALVVGLGVLAGLAF